MHNHTLTLHPNADTSQISTTLTPKDANESFIYEPGGYLEVIPWSELESVPKENIPLPVRQAFGLDNEEHSRQFCLFVPKSQSLLDFHIISEDEVHQYRLEHDFCSLGHSFDGKVLFVKRPFDDKLFSSDFQNFWSLWVSLFSLSDQSRETETIERLQIDH